MLDRLTVFEVVERDVLAKRIAPLRAALKEKLLALSDGAEGQEKADLVGLAKHVEGLAPDDVLKPETIALAAETGEGPNVWRLNGKFFVECRLDGTIRSYRAGTWRWLNQQRTFLVVEFPDHNHLDLICLKSPLALEASGFNNKGDRFRFSRKTATAVAARKPAAKALEATAGTVAAENELRSKANKEIAKRREGVARWLVDQAKVAPPAVAMKVLAEAGNLRPQAAGSSAANASPFAGIWTMDDRSKLELRPDGTVRCSRPGTVTWSLSRNHDRRTAFILFGKPDDPVDVWIARLSAHEPGVLRVYSRDKTASARLQ
jgi:hypothetical protein